MAYTTIDDPSAYFQAKGYAGNSVDNTAITNDGNSNLQPDLIWFARYDTPASKFLLDSSRGVTKRLKSDANDAEGTSTSLLKSFDTNGFSVGTNSNSNSSSSNYIAWQWKANGGTTSSNTDGDITTTVQANTTSGFSILTWTGNASPSQSLGHGLGVTPKIMFNKNRDASVTWQLFGSTVFDRMQFNTGGDDNNFPCTFSSTTITLPNLTNNTEFNASGYDFVSYVFAEKQGYSKFGSYTGNGNANGTFVYTGFKPAVVLFKRTDTTSNWSIITGATIQKNVIDERFTINLGNIQGVADWADFISNGFKIRDTNAGLNASGGTYIYMAFAENPFVTSTGIPTTAR